MKGLALTDSPPLSVPLSFLLAAPVAMVAGGVLLAARGPEALQTTWAPVTVALTHLGTLGLLATAMFGALYQLAPVVAGRHVPGLALARVVQPLLLGGVAALVWGMAGGPRLALSVAIAALGGAVVVFGGQLGLALSRPGPASPTVDGMRLALVALGVVATLGCVMAWRLATDTVTPSRPAWLQAHVVVGLLGWVGALLAAVSWRVIPMFQLCPEVPLGSRRATLALVAVTLPLTLGLLAAGSGHVALGGLPAGLAVWGLNPVATQATLARRRRPGRDAGLLGWQLSLACAVATGMAAVAALTLSDPRAPLLFGWLALWGWAGTAVHGMLTRIVPFLTWYHRSSGHLGAPTMRSLLPDRRARIGLALHLAALLAGIAAIATGSAALAHGTGALVALTGAWLGGSLVAVTLPREGWARG